MTDQIKIGILLQKEIEGTEKLNVPMLIHQTVRLNQNQQIMLNQIILKLKKKGFFEIFEVSVSYYHNQKQLFVFGFFIPKEIDDKELEEFKFRKKIPYEALEANSQNKDEPICRLRLRKRIKTKVELLKLQQVQKYGEPIHDHDENKKNTKQKEKTIGEVIEKVALWRKLYTGFPSQTGKIVHYELEKAAVEIGVAKKTLDDYLLQIRNGKRHGYNFNKNKNSKIGALRSFVKQNKSKESKEKQIKN